MSLDTGEAVVATGVTTVVLTDVSTVVVRKAGDVFVSVGDLIFAVGELFDPTGPAVCLMGAVGIWTGLACAGAG